MKRLIYGLLAILMMAGVASCQSDNDPLADGNYRLKVEKEINIMKTIRMSFGGDYVTESEEPLMRAEDGETYTAINVWRTEDKADAVEERYAYGLFKGIDFTNNKNSKGLSIDLESGHKYRFEASILIEDKDIVLVREDGNEKYYDVPFDTSNGGFHVEDLDKFHYTYLKQSIEKFYFNHLKKGTTYVNAGDDLSSTYGDVWYPRVKRYYGTYSDFNPTSADEINIPMGYKSFGLKLEVVDLPSGYLTVRDNKKGNGITLADAEKRLIFTEGLRLTKEEPGNVWECLYSMNSLTDESETFTLEFSWYKGGGKPETFETTFTVKPNTKKVLKINVSGTPTFNVEGNLFFNLETEELTEEEEEIKHDFDDDKTN